MERCPPFVDLGKQAGGSPMKPGDMVLPRRSGMPLYRNPDRIEGPVARVDRDSIGIVLGFEEDMGASVWLRVIFPEGTGLASMEWMDEV